MENTKELKRLIAVSYGESDKIFALHTLDVQRAQLALIEAFKLGIGFQEYIDLHRSFLHSKNVHPEFIEKQLKEVKNIHRYFIED